jgi:hypothetical protein
VNEQTAKFLENVEIVKALADSSEFMGAVPIAGSFVLLILRGMYESIALRAFGKLDLTAENVQWTLGTVLRDLGRMLRKERVGMSKGRANTELLETLRIIRYSVGGLWHPCGEWLGHQLETRVLPILQLRDAAGT